MARLKPLGITQNSKVCNIHTIHQLSIFDLLAEYVPILKPAFLCGHLTELCNAIDIEQVICMQSIDLSGVTDHAAAFLFSKLVTTSYVT